MKCRHMSWIRLENRPSGNAGLRGCRSVDIPAVQTLLRHPVEIFLAQNGDQRLLHPRRHVEAATHQNGGAALRTQRPISPPCSATKCWTYFLGVASRENTRSVRAKVPSACQAWMSSP